MFDWMAHCLQHRMLLYSLCRIEFLTMLLQDGQLSAPEESKLGSGCMELGKIIMCAGASAASAQPWERGGG